MNKKNGFQTNVQWPSQGRRNALTIFPLYTHKHKRLLLSMPVALLLATSREFPKWLTKPIASVSTKAKMVIYSVSLSRAPVPSNYNSFTRDSRGPTLGAVYNV